MLPSHRERLFQVKQETGLDFIQTLSEPEYFEHVQATTPTPTETPNSTTAREYVASDVLDKISNGPPNIVPPRRCASNVLGAQAGPGETLGIPGLDSILLQHGLLHRGDLLDLFGPSSSGKTLLLYAIMIATILPNTWKYSRSRPSASLKGKARSVIFIDMEQGFDAKQLRSLLCIEIRKRLRLTEQEAMVKTREQDVAVDAGAKTDSRESKPEREHECREGMIDIHSPEMQMKIDQLVNSCLQNVHVFRPPDAISAIVILRTLDQYISHSTSAPAPLATSPSTLLAAATTTGPSPPFSLLILDALSSFYWQERCQPHAVHATLASTTQQPSSVNITNFNNRHTRITTVLVDALNRLASRWGLIFISTSWSLPSSSLASDRTITDVLRARIRYRFLTQPRTLERFESQGDLMSEWKTIARARNHARSRREELRNGNAVFIEESPCDHENYIESVFQAQMLIPSVEQQYQGPELFRFAISNTHGFNSFSVLDAPSHEQ